MPRLKTETAVFRIGITVPNGANMKDCEDYIREAVKRFREASTATGFYVERTSPLLNLDAETVRVSLLERHTLYVDSGNHGGGKRKRSNAPTT